MGISLGGKLQTSFLGSIAICLDFIQYSLIIVRIADNCNRSPVLGSTAKHRRTSNVDMFNGILHGDIGFCYGLTERIKVHTDQVDSLYSIVLQLFHVLWDIPAGQESSMDFRMKSLDSAITDFRESCHVADACDLQSGFLQHFHCAAGRDDFPSHLRKFG